MKILLAINGSEPSKNALAEVVARPWPPRSTVDVVTVVEPAHLWATSETADIVFRRSTDLLRETLEQLRAAGLDADGDILQGDPKAAILDRAEQTKAGYLVLGSHNVSAVARFLLGNVASNVLRHAPCSVLIASPSPGRTGSRSCWLRMGRHFRRLPCDRSLRGRGLRRASFVCSASLNSPCPSLKRCSNRLSSSLARSRFCVKRP
jgi:nucleotide-binding universal stress UspA family protein